MSRGNIILTAVLAVVVGIWLMTRESEGEKTTGPAPRLFPEFNKEAVDNIVIEGGWEKTRWVFSRLGSQWTLASAGGYPVVADTVNDFIAAVYNLRKDALVGSSGSLHKSSRTDAQGRVVRLYKGRTPTAEFRIGKTPDDSSQTFFIRKEGEDDVFRTRTLDPEALENAPKKPASPWDTGPSGFRWTDYTKQITDWLVTQVWRLGNAETQKIKLIRKGKYDIEITRKGDEEWELTEAGKKEKTPADVDATTAIYDDLRYLNFVDVLGKFVDVNEEYGLDKPEIILYLTLKKKVEKKEDEKKDDKDEKKKKDEYKVFKRFLAIGKKITRPSSYDDETGEVKEDSYYAVQIGGEFDADEKETEERAKYVFLVDAVNLRGLRKELDEFKQKVEEKDEDEGDKKDEDAGDKDKDADKDSEKKDSDAGKDDESKEEPKKEEPKKEEPKKEEPKKEEPKKEDDPKKDDG